MISIICPAYNEADNLGELYRRVSLAMQKSDEDFELIIVENGSSDSSLEKLIELRNRDKRVKYLSLSRNFGHQGAILAGLHYAKGQAVISMDADLQHPPELIPSLIEHWKNGSDIVHTIKNLSRTNIPKVRYFFTRLFYKLMSFLSGLKLEFGQSDFRLLDRKVVDVIDRIPAKDWFLRGMVSWVGFRQTGIQYEVKERFSGSSKFSFFDLLSFALRGVFSFSIIPLRIMTFAGLGIASLSMLYGIWVIIIYLMKYFGLAEFPLPPGWATISFTILFLGSSQLIFMGLLGEYVGRTFHQTLGRPPFIVNSSAMDDD